MDSTKKFKLVLKDKETKPVPKSFSSSYPQHGSSWISDDDKVLIGCIQTGKLITTDPLIEERSPISQELMTQIVKRVILKDRHDIRSDNGCVIEEQVGYTISNPSKNFTLNEVDQVVNLFREKMLGKNNKGEISVSISTINTGYGFSSGHLPIESIINLQSTYFDGIHSEDSDFQPDNVYTNPNLREIDAFEILIALEY